MSLGPTHQSPSAVPAGPVAIVGAGTMGAGLAQVAAAAGLRVVLYSRTRRTLDRATAAIDASVRRLARRDGVAPDTDEVLSRITLSTDLDACAPASVLIESVAEDLALKRRLFTELDALCAGATLLATNTSQLRIGAIAEATRRPERVVGMHFFAPVPVMRLCEVVRGPATSQAVMDAARALAEQLGKQTVVVRRDNPGFITTRLLSVLILEAIRMVEDGTCDAADLDLACRLGFGHPMGPLASVDLSGLDVFHAVATGLHQATGNPLYEVPELLRELVAAGHHGRKSGRGFHDYPAPERTGGAPA